MAKNDFIDLQKLCWKNALKLCALTEKHDNVCKSCQPLADDSQLFDLRCDHIRLRCLAEQRDLEANKPSGLPLNKKLLFSQVVQVLRDQLRSSKETLEAVRAEKAKLLETKSKLEKQLEEEQRMMTIVKDKCREDGILNSDLNMLDQTVSPGEDQVNVAKKLQDKVKKLKKLMNLRMKQLSDFLEEHFPEPTENEELKSDIFEIYENPRRSTLSMIIQELVNIHLKNPLSWVPIDYTMPIPYVELLLRTGIVVRNKNNPSQIRLQNFND